MTSSGWVNRSGVRTSPSHNRRQPKSGPRSPILAVLHNHVDLAAPTPHQRTRQIVDRSYSKRHLGRTSASDPAEKRSGHRVRHVRGSSEPVPLYLTQNGAQYRFCWSAYSIHSLDQRLQRVNPYHLREKMASDFSNFCAAQTFGKLQKCPDRGRFRLIVAALPTELSTDPGTDQIGASRRRSPSVPRS